MGRFTVNEPSTPGRFSAGRFYVAPEEDEDKFQRWYAAQAKRWGLDPNPDAPAHKYDYRAAFKAGQGPDPKTGHWPSTFKADDHPNRFVGIIDTKTGQPAPAWMRDEVARREPARLPGGLAASPAVAAAVAQGREPDLGRTDVSAPRGAWNPLMGPPEGSSGPVRSPLGERASADIASNAFGPFVGLGERVGLVPEGTREALREESLRLQEQAFLADPEGGVGRAVAQTGREILTGLPGPSLLLGPVAGKGGAVLARAAGAGRLGQAGAAVAAGAAEQGVENWFDTVDRPTSERLASVAIGGGLGLAGGVGDLRAAREAAGSALDSLADKVQAARRGTPPVVESLDEQRFSEFVRGQGLDPYDLDAGLEADLRKRLRAQETAPLPPDPRPDIVPDAERGVYRVGDQEFSNIHQATIFRESLDPETGAPPPQITPERWRQLREANGRAVEPAPGAVEPRSPLDPAPPTREPEIVAPVGPGELPDTVTVPRPEPRGTAVTERGSRIEFDYEIRDASSLVTSHDDTLRVNPVYPAEVQPRDRSRVASAAQVSRIEQRLDPELLGASPKVSDGAPFVGPDGVVESGNARSIAIRRAYLSASPQGESYRGWLREAAPRLGLDPAAVDAVPNPVLVRVRRTPVDRAAFAVEANESGLAAMSAAERAAADAQALTPDMLAALRIPENGGGVNLQANRDFVRAFASRINPAEQGSLFDARGALSIEGERRIQNAILARAFGDPLAVAKLTEHADSNVRAVGSALVREAPRFARMRDGIAAGRLYPLDISEDVSAALRKLSSLREEGMQVQDYLAQGALFGSDLTPEARGLLALFDANSRSGSRVGEILGRYVAGVEALGDPAQARLFGQVATPSKLDLLRTVAPDDQRVLLAQADAAFVAEGGVLPARLGEEALLPPPRPGAPRGTRPPQGDLPGIEAPSSSPARMSTKGIENIAGMQDDLARVVAENRPEIYAARGEPVPVSRWHDAEGLQQRLRLTADDYLKWPKDRSFSTDEHALGRHYKGRMKLEVDELSGRISRGEIPEADLPAALAQKAELERNVVRMMATLQGQGSSEFGRAMRSLQEALDPHGLADTPKEKLQLALLKHYGRKNAEEAARLEQRAVQRLAAQAKREARKAGRTATLEDLSAEFSALSSEFGKKASTPRMGLDPELVALIGKMAANRVKAGVVAVEEIADQIYMVVRNQVEGLEREDVKAAIVEHALAPKPKRQGLAPGERRIRTAESAAERSLRKLEERIAAGGAPASKPAPVTSPKLEQLRTQRDALRQQLAAMQGKAPKDPVVRKLAARERAAARVVEKLEAKLAAGPALIKESNNLTSPQLEALRQKADALRAQIAKDPKQGLAARYRALLDDQTVAMIAALPDDPADPALLTFLRQMEKPSFRDFRTTYWINSILSGAKTAIKNLGGNVVRLGELTVMRPVDAAVEAGLARAQGRAPQKIFREVLPATAGVFRGIPDGVKKFAFVMKNGYDPGRIVAELTEGGGSKFDQALPVSPFVLSEKPWVRAVGVPLTMPTRILEATDALFKTMAATSEGYAWATRKAVQEGAPDIPARVAQLLQEMPEEMVAAQTAYAKRATYQDPMSWVGSAASSLRRGIPGSDALASRLRERGGVANRTVAAVVQGPQTVMQHLLPFVHISDRVAAAATDYIPLSKPAKLAGALVSHVPEIWDKLPGGVEKYLRTGPGEAADLIARQAVGGALALLGIGWAAEGKLVGAAPKDEKLRNDFYAEGKQPYSLLVGGRWVPMRDALGPWAGPFVAAAMYNDHLAAGEDPSAAVPGMALGTARYMLDASYMATLQQVVEAVESEQQAGRGIVQASARVAGGYVPFSGLVRNTAIARDPRVVEKEGFVDELKSGIPGLREQLPARRGTLGEELRISTGSAGGFLPVVPTENKVADPALAEEVERLRSTVAGRRTEINRVLDQIKDARKAKDGARVRELLATLPGASDRVQGDAALARVRGLEQQLRRLRADEKVSPERKRARELAMQKQMRDILSKALQRMGTQP